MELNHDLPEASTLAITLPMWIIWILTCLISQPWSTILEARTPTISLPLRLIFNLFYFFLEYSGKWKMLHYFAKHFFSPLLISPTQDLNSIEVYIIMDQIPSSVHRHPQTGQVHFKPLTKLFAPWNPQQQANVQSSVTSGTLYIQMYSWDNMQPLHTWKQTYDVSFLNCDCCFSV
jgi:hypothetical protein